MPSVGPATDMLGTVQNINLHTTNWAAAVTGFMCCEKIRKHSSACLTATTAIEAARVNSTVHMPITYRVVPTILA